MTNREAIRLIRNHPTMCEFTDAYGKLYYEAVDMAISALQEQELKQEVKNSNGSSLTQNGLDTISRQAWKMTREEAIETLHEIQRDAWPNSYTEKACEMAIKALGQEPCEDAVSREAAIDAALSAFSRGLLASPDIRRLPSVQPERKRGKWINISDGIFEIVKCDQCGRTMDSRDNFCPNCGANMTEDSE